MVHRIRVGLTHNVQQWDFLETPTTDNVRVEEFLGGPCVSLCLKAMTKILSNLKIMHMIRQNAAGL